MKARWAAAAGAGAALAVAAAVSVPAASSGTGTLYGCVSSSHALTHVSLSSPLPCPSQTPVSWPVTAGVSPSPSPPPSPSPSVSPSPSPSPTASSACTVSGAQGACPYQDPAIFGDNYQTLVNQDVWNPPADFTGKPCQASGPQPSCQAVTAYSPEDWSVTASYASTSGAVLSYPDVQQVYSNRPLDGTGGLTSLSSSYAENMNATSATQAEAAWDIFLNGWANEVMIWADTTPLQRQALAYDTPYPSAPPGGWAVYCNGACNGTSEVIVAANTDQQSGTVDLLSILRWLEQQGAEPSGSTLTGVDFGWEICSTGGQPETFQLTGYTLTGS